FQRDRNTVADALGVPALDRSADVERKVFWFDQTGGKFSRMQRDMNLGIDTVQVVEHSHVTVEIVGGNVPVFGHDKIEPDEMRIRRCKFETEDDLRKDGLR